jgi:prepilin-type N-terminal cleavage/methylation domain-containing protein
MHSRPSKCASRSAFTLIELLVVIAIIAILAVVVVLTLNPAEMLRQARDANRLSDLATINSALNLYTTDQSGSSGFSLGNASSVYLSLPDASNTCNNLGLATTSGNFAYACSTSTSSRNINNSGWIPVNFSLISSGSPLGSLPVDPVNQSSSGLYYTYYTNGNQFEVTSLFESQKNKTQYGQKPIVQSYPEVNAQGSSLTINPLFNPSGLVGYWPMDEGSGSSTQDLSGNNNLGTWSGAAAGTNNTYYATGKVGSYAGYFNGINNSITLPTLSVNSVSIAGWLSPGALTQYYNAFVILSDSTSANVIGIRIDQSTPVSVELLLNISSTNVVDKVGSLKLTSGYNFITMTFDASAHAYAIYINGQLSDSGTFSGSLLASYSKNCMSCINGVIANNYAPFNGLDDVRIYNRALSAAEVQALYNAEK